VNKEIKTDANLLYELRQIGIFPAAVFSENH